MALRSVAGAGPESAPEALVRRFLTLLDAGDAQAAGELLHPELVYTNVSLPSIRGGERVTRLFERAMGSGLRADIQVHELAADGDSVLTERTDVLRVGGVHVAFWVCGVFRVRDGRIVLWRDYFDWMDFSRGVLRGAVGAFVPALRPSLPAERE